MRIAQIAPLAESVPPKMYGGTERVVSWLTEELVLQGHDVTLFASGDSVTSATLSAGAKKSLRAAGLRDHLASTIVMLDQVRRQAHKFDILHFHVDLLQFPLFQHLFHKSLTTLHGRLDMPDFHPVYRVFPAMPLISISDHQRTPMPPVKWVDTIYHGLPKDLFHLNTGAGGYLAFLGRISPEKRVDRAIEIAIRSGVPLKIAAKIDPVDAEYFSGQIQPMLNHPLVEFIGEINDHQKQEFLGRAQALLFPIDWPEPFGLVMIEAMATGTPVIAWRNGSVPEIIEDRRTGFIVDSMDEAAVAVARVRDLNRTVIRQRFEARFTVTRMAEKYLASYERLLSDFRKPRGKPSHDMVRRTVSAGSLVSAGQV